MEIFLTRAQTMALDYHGFIKIDNYIIIKEYGNYYVSKIIDDSFKIHLEQKEFKIVEDENSKINK